MKKEKETPGDIILQKCNKNHDQCVADKIIFSFWINFCPFIPHNSRKNQNFKKMKKKKNARRYHHLTHVYHR